jgi:hypothetical protein
MKFSKQLNKIIFPEDFRVGSRLNGGAELLFPTGKFCWRLNRLIGTFKPEPKKFFVGSEERSIDK